MATVNLRRINCAAADAGEQIAALRARLSPQGDMVSARGRKLTEAVFGEPLPPTRVVERICADVKNRGLPALLHYTEKLDGVRLTAETLRVSAQELAEARAAVDPAFLETVRRIRQNILSFQLGLLHRDAVLMIAGSHELRLRYRPMRCVGICIPGGAAAYPSTVLMTVCPAQAAGVKELAVVMPPTPFGGYNREMLATCHELGVSEVYRVGGAQAVAALAYGTIGSAPVDMIVGPGSLFVMLAKRHVFGQVAIDMLAGPTEVVVLADHTARADFVAADLISQAEHAPGASMLITWHAPLLDEVVAALERQLPALPRGDLAREPREFRRSHPGARCLRSAGLGEPNRAGAPPFSDTGCGSAAGSGGECGGRLPGALFARRSGRLRSWSFACASDRRYGPVRQRPLGERFHAAIQRGAF